MPNADVHANLHLRQADRCQDSSPGSPAPLCVCVCVSVRVYCEHGICDSPLRWQATWARYKHYSGKDVAKDERK